MSLSRELCEALRVLPEVRDRNNIDGGMYYLHRDGSWIGPVNVDEQAWGLDEGVPMVWAPSLAELLAIVSECYPDIDLQLRRERRRLKHSRWVFCDGDLGNPGELEATGATPEEAVAQWLLYRPEVSR